MYLPRAFAEPDRARLFDLIDAEAFGALVVAGTSAVPEIAHIPFLLDRDRGACGVLRGHVARANPIWRELAGSRELTGRRELAGARSATAVFQGPHAYVSPLWYRSRQEVPTWNYAVVHAVGVARVFEERAELRRLLADLAARHEEGEAPWSLADLDPHALERMLGEIVGFELEIRELRGKLKLSQNRAEPDRLRVRDALRRRARPADLRLADLMDGG